jgi:hypothetical protein
LNVQDRFTAISDANSLTPTSTRIGLTFSCIIFSAIIKSIINLIDTNILYAIISIITTIVYEIVSVSVNFFQNLIHKVIYMLLAECVASNTGLDDKAEHTQATVGKEKYKNAEYDDNIIEYLMKYLGLESYEQLQDSLEHSHIPIFN